MDSPGGNQGPSSERDSDGTAEGLDQDDGAGAPAAPPSARDFDQELWNLFDGYVHGHLDCRGFLDRAGKFAVGGMTAAGLLDMLSPRFAEAQQNQARRQAPQGWLPGD